MNAVNKLPFKKTGIAIAVLNALAIINAAKYFLLDAKFPVPAWLFFNVCVPSVILYLIGFFSKRREIMASSLPFMLFYGGGGLFVFSWAGYAVIAQAGHILMVLAIIYSVAVFILEKNWKLPAAGFFAGLVIFAIIMPIQQNYVRSHPEYLKKLGDPKFEKLNKNN